MQVFICKQWMLFVEDDGNYRIENQAPDGERRYYRVVPGAYGEPLIEVEPDLAFEAPVDLDYVAKDGWSIAPIDVGKIGGIICENGPRTSLTKAKRDGIVIRVNDDGSIQVGDGVWWIATILDKDKNRFRGGKDAFLVRDKPSKVRVLELADLNLF